MKKIFAFVLALCLLCGTTAFATTITGTTSNSASTELKMTVGESFTVVIPATVDIDFGALSTDLSVEVTDLRTYSTGTIDNTVRKLYVKAGNYIGYIENENGDRIDYSIGGSEADTGKYLYFTEPMTKNFTIDIKQSEWDAAPAGTYTNTISFTIAIANFSN